jgi:predicted HicB family RNase H-like nuclease
MLIKLIEDRGAKTMPTKGKESDKAQTKSIYIRAPESIYKDVHKIAKITGISINAVCLELLRPAIKARLQELKE